MYTMTILKANLTEDAYTQLGHMAVDHHAVILANDIEVTLELRTIRIDGVDVTGEERALEASDLLFDLVPFASDYDSIPTANQTAEPE